MTSIVEMETLWGYRCYSAAALPAETGVQHSVSDFIAEMLLNYLQIFDSFPRSMKKKKQHVDI